MILDDEKALIRLAFNNAASKFGLVRAVGKEKQPEMKNVARESAQGSMISSVDCSAKSCRPINNSKPVGYVKWIKAHGSWIPLNQTDKGDQSMSIGKTEPGSLLEDTMFSRKSSSIKPVSTVMNRSKTNKQIESDCLSSSLMISSSLSSLNDDLTMITKSIDSLLEPSVKKPDSTTSKLPESERSAKARLWIHRP